MRAKKISGAKDDPTHLRSELCAALLSEPNISDCAVTLRRSDEETDEWIAYIVTTGPLDQSAINDRLVAVLADSFQTIHLVPLYNLPLSPDGSTDYRALDAIPVFDNGLLERCEEALRKHAPIKNAALVCLRRQPPEIPPYHLADLWLPSPRHGGPEEVLPLPAYFEHAQGTPAILHGQAFPVDASNAHTTLQDVLRTAASEHGDQRLRFMSANGDVVEWRYRHLATRAERVYGGMLALGLKPGDKVIFQLRRNQDILTAFWACQLGGFIPTITEVPNNYDSGGPAVERLDGLLRLLDFPLIVADDSIISFLQDIGPATFSHKLRTCSIDNLRSNAPAASEYRSQPDDTALFALSSGSTGVPKCIILSHRNLLTRAIGANQLCSYSPQDIVLNWLPLDHIGAISDWHIRCVLLGCELVYVHRDLVLRDPTHWLHLIDRFRITHSWAPNFAFSLVIDQLEKSDTKVGWDLSCVQGLLTAGEPVSKNSIQRFIRALSKYRLNATAIWPAFGMAELGSGITYFVPSPSRPLHFHTIRKPSMGTRIEHVAKDDPTAATFADLGAPIPGVSLRVVDDHGNAMPMNTVGHLQVRSDVVFRGYFSNPNATSSAFSIDGWFNTADLGFLSQGSLVLTGREKDIIVINGSNYYSHEIEGTTNQIHGVRPAFTAACAVRWAQDENEKLAIFFVPESEEDQGQVIRFIRHRIAGRFGISPAFLVPLEKHQIPKTTVGKIQRARLKQQFEAGAFDATVKRVDLLLESDNTLPRWFYQITWVPKISTGAPRYPTTGAIMIFADTWGLGNLLCNRLAHRAQAFVIVTPGDRFVRHGDNRFEIDLRSKSMTAELLQVFASEGPAISEIVSLIDYRPSDSNFETAACSHPLVHESVIRLLHLIQASFGRGATAAPRRFAWVANDSQCVDRTDLGTPEKAMMMAFVSTLQLEFPSIECRHIDLPGFDHASNADLLISELNTPSKDLSVAYRNRQRFIPRLKLLNLVDEGLSPVEISTGGCYLVTGGLGGLGFEICRWLGREHQSRILIIGRSPLGEEGSRTTASEETSRDLQARYRSLRDEAIDCDYVQADVGDAEAIRAVVESAEKKWKHPLEGIFHLAGMVHESALTEESADQFARTARPKIQGISALGKLLETRSKAFLIAFSSTNAKFGGIHVGSYSAANAYMESYCRRLSRLGFRAYCHAWSSWQGLGMSRHSATESIASAKGFRPIALVDGISSLRAAMHSGQPEAIIGLDAGKNSIQALLSHGCYEQQSVRAYVELRKGESAASIPDTAKFRDRFGTTFECRIESSSHLPLLPDGKPDKERLLESIANYGARERKHSQDPTATEARLIGIWKDLLHLTSVGIDDDFFDLGGDSLRAIQLVGAIERMFGKPLAIATVFQAPTIRTLADALGEDAVRFELCSVMPIKATGRRTPLFVVQSSTWDLVRYVDPEQPVYGLTYGVCAEASKHTHDLPSTLEELAANYIREMRTVQRRGPYLLIGHSAAGLVAYEMARQLSKLVEEVALVGLIDTHVPRDYYNTHVIKNRKGLSAFSDLPSILASALSWRTARHHFRKLAMRMFEKPSEIPFTIRAKHLFDNYTPLPYHGKVSYWKCVKDGSMEEERHDELVWEQLAEAGLRLNVLDCRHDQIMKDPHVKILADQINQYAKCGEDD